jgi:O-succinylbenzoic acid--CoA ligase
MDGKLYPLGRVDQMFISGGENIHPEEIEKIFHQMGIFAIVVPVPDDRYGERPVAFLNLSTLDEPIVSEIEAAMMKHLPKFKHPDHLFLWPEVISTYKPSRQKLQRIAKTMIDHDRR